MSGDVLIIYKCRSAFKMDSNSHEFIEFIEFFLQIIEELRHPCSLLFVNLVLHVFSLYIKTTRTLTPFIS